jgi:hypothetical protein
MRREDLDVFADLETDVELTESDVEYLNSFEGKRSKGKSGKGTIVKKSAGSYRVRLRGRHLGLRNTLDAARELLREAVRQEEDEKARRDRLAMIPRTADGFAFLTTKTGEQVLVDDDIYIAFRDRIIGMRQGYPLALNKLLHKHILQLNDGEACVDHINGDKLDNRRANLRGTTSGTNARNRKPKSNTGYLGVSEVKGSPGVFSAKATNWKVKPPDVFRRRFRDVEEAVRWRKQKMDEIYPEDRCEGADTSDTDDTDDTDDTSDTDDDVDFDEFDDDTDDTDDADDRYFDDEDDTDDDEQTSTMSDV